MADVIEDEERRADLFYGEGVDVAFGLGVGAFEGFVEGGGAALVMAAGLGRGFAWEFEE
ncbi:hypothetical protein [Haloferula sp.]|uniref:hypothetical protein n=1 Tax=Haloferula sp. TaxID=2497595 RepID=UPI003C72181E